MPPAGFTQKVELKTIKSREESIHQCIGQVLTYFGEKDDDGGMRLIGGTGILFKKLPNNHYLVLTAASNIVHYDYTSNIVRAKKLWFLPSGSFEQNVRIRMRYIKEVIYHGYEADKTLSPDDLAVLLVHDKKKQISVYDDINVDEVINITECDEDYKELTSVNIYGYPSQSNGALQGISGDATLRRKDGFWKYTDINTYPGQTGSPIYKETMKQNQYEVYGIHLVRFDGVGHGVYFDSKRIKWIKKTVRQFESGFGVKESLQTLEDEKELEMKEMRLKQLRKLGYTEKICIEASNAVTDASDIHAIIHKIREVQDQMLLKLLNLSKKEQKAIKNPLILILSIAEYDAMKINNLDGVKVDLENYRKLWNGYYGYDIYPTAKSKKYGTKFRWTRKHVFTFLENYRQKVFMPKYPKLDDDKDDEDEDEDEDVLEHDAIIVICRGHGVSNAIITSDNKLITIKELHNKMSWKEAVKGIPRFFIIDACRGDDDPRETQTLPSLPTTANIVTLYGNPDDYVTFADKKAGGLLSQTVIETFQVDIKKGIHRSLGDLFMEMTQDLEVRSEGKQQLQIAGTNKWNKYILESKLENQGGGGLLMGGASNQNKQSDLLSFLTDCKCYKYYKQIKEAGYKTKNDVVNADEKVLKQMMVSIKMNVGHQALLKNAIKKSKK